MRIIFVLAIILIVQPIISQNLVLNPSFELRKSENCIYDIGQFDRKVLHWSASTMATTDIFDRCNTSRAGINNYNGYQNPKSGNSYAGIYTYSNNNYREYVQGELSKSLESGKTYRVQFYLSLADKSSYAIKDIQVLFTEEKLKPCYQTNNCQKAIKPSKSVEGKFRLYSNAEAKFFAQKDIWMMYWFEFTAEGYENYFSIGNFYRNNKTSKQKLISNSPEFFSYYYIDDISVTALEPFKESKFISQNIEQNEEYFDIDETYTFKNVLFEFDKADLLAVSIDELQKLYIYLRKNHKLSIEIYGHTDHKGTQERNKELSQLRAKAVADYLISQGLESARITYFGFGSSQPISKNTTEKGRKLNRRVEFKIIE